VAAVAVVSGGGDSAVGADRAIARQLDDLVAELDPDAAVVVVDSAEDERVVPIVESRLPVDSVDRVVVRQAHDLESTYYLLKQFLADEELRSTVLVPLGVALLIVPALLWQFSPAVALAAVAALAGLVLLYKGLAIDSYLATVPERAREALYAGQVSVVTYVAAVGLALVGASLGALAVSELRAAPAITGAMRFLYAGVPWFAAAAVVAATGRLLDELIREEAVRTPFLNLPFLLVAVGLICRGFAGYVLEREGILDPPTIAGVAITPGQRLAGFILLGIAVSLVGVRAASGADADALEDVIGPGDREPEGGRQDRRGR
jgi:putative membrane protein